MEDPEDENIEEQKKQAWIQKAIHGKHPNYVNNVNINKQLSYKFLTSGYLFPETEGFLMAIQDQVIATKNYRKYVIKDKTVLEDKCRKCHQTQETIDHITGGASFQPQLNTLKGTTM